MIIIKRNLKFTEHEDITNLSIEGTIEISRLELDQFVILWVYTPSSTN